MLVKALAMLLMAAAPQKPPAAAVAPASLLATTPTPGYEPIERAVDNWRLESALTLRLSPLQTLRRVADVADREPGRCVKLNNYWCVKRAGWNGEIAADADGHVAFASAEEGAAVAALLLRRYYVEYKRRSARAIVERWAPAQCSPMAALRPQPGAVASRATMARMLPQRVVTMGGIAPRGIQNTLRARWLAAHGRGGVVVAPPSEIAQEREYDDIRRRNAAWVERARRKVAAYRAEHPIMMPAPAIMEGGGEARRRGRAAPRMSPRITTRSIDDAIAAATPVSSVPTPVWGSCSNELSRIANYAAHIAEGVAAGPLEDLRLFDAAGRPTANLTKVMINMAAVEIGPDRPRDYLIVAAVAQLKRMLEDPALALLAAPKEAEDKPVTDAARDP